MSNSQERIPRHIITLNKSSEKKVKKRLETARKYDRRITV